MPNKVEIANLALGNIRAASILNFSESSLEAQTINARYDIARRYVLRAFPWNFCNKIEALAETAETIIKYTYVYTYPADCLRANSLVPNFLLGTDRTAYLRFYYDYPMDRRVEDLNSQFQPFEIGNINDTKVIMTDLSEAYLQYTSDVIDTTLFDENFVEALSWYLAAQCAIPVVGAEKGREMRADALRIYNTFINEAQVINANERKQPEMAKSDYTLVREY
jgi:hypothetical protein